MRSPHLSSFSIVYFLKKPLYSRRKESCLLRALVFLCSFSNFFFCFLSFPFRRRLRYHEFPAAIFLYLACKYKNSQRSNAPLLWIRTVSDEKATLWPQHSSKHDETYVGLFVHLSASVCVRCPVRCSFGKSCP